MSFRGITVVFSFRPTWLLAGALFGSIVPDSGFAQQLADNELPFFVRLGYGQVYYRTTGRASVAGQPLSNGRVALNDVRFAALELGWRFAPDWSISVLGGLPPTVVLQGRGDFAAQGLLRKVTYGSIAAGIQYHPFKLGRFEPFVGGGLNYTMIFRTRGGSLSELNVADNAGPYVQVGGQFRLTDRLSALADVRKTWLSFDSKGMAGGVPIRVGIDPDPVSVTLGLSYRF